MQHYLENDPKLGKYVPIIHDSLVYPVIMDSHRTVLSLPPIINGAHSAVTFSFALALFQVVYAESCLFSIVALAMWRLAYPWEVCRQEALCPTMTSRALKGRLKMATLSH